MPEQRPQPPAPGPPTPARRWKRTAAAALLLLAGGAVVNVAVAWGCVLLYGHDINVTTAKDAEWGEARIRKSFESLPFRDRFVEVESARISSRMEGASPGLRCRAAWLLVCDRVCRELLEDWIRWRVGTQHPSGYHVLAYQQYDAGLPLSALTGETWLVRRTIGQANDGIHWTQTPEAAALAELVGEEVAINAIAIPRKGQNFISFSGYWGFSMVPLPLRPVLPGFIINTLFYTLLLWLLLFAPFEARRMLRRRRGQCEKCAYPIGVSPVCTECGAAVRPSVARSS